MVIVWNNRKNWLKSAHNTKWCLIGCAIGDLGTIAYFQFTEHSLSTLTVMLLAMFNGLVTSIILETIILYRAKFTLIDALKTAFGMSFISMLAMELAMNITDFLLTGGAILTWWVLPITLLAGFLTPWPYNYWRLEKHGKSCH
ncbi:DUF4396 domain-containing protein [Thalassotalea atypica]|uniref:DUF4396 domain-containing protein n=1 Tax=Thalassotalea atypica TaxID=2054316 RepID=UPI002572C33D|nr:DUF4396 domain-containing protein [Thalassotalea atypica]